MTEQDLETLAKSKLSSKRFLHVLGVRQTAITLSMRWNVDKNEAGCAALLHDITKEDKDQLKLCQQYDIIPPEWGEKEAKLLHALTAAAFAEQNGFSQDVVQAVRWHTTGREKMSVMEKIIYLSDWIEPNRKSSAKSIILRNLCFENLDKAMLAAINMSVENLIKQNSWLHPATLSARNYLLDILKLGNSG